MTVSEIWRRIKWWAIYNGPKRDITVQTFNGLLTFESKQWLIGKYLYVRREHEESEIRQVISILETEGYDATSGTLVNGMLVNIGANIGMTAIALIKAGAAQGALAIEPAPENFRLLVRNIEQNGLSGKIRPVHAAISSCNGVLDLELSESNSGDHRIRNVSEAGFYNEQSRRTIKIEAHTLDRLAETMGVHVGLIWIDAQGHEGHILLGAKNVLGGGIPVVSEFWPYGVLRSGQTMQEFLAILEDLFESFYVAEPAAKRRPIFELGELAKEYDGPRRFCTLVLMPRRSS